MKIVFWGTPEFSVSLLATLHNSHHQIIQVISQPDKPKGRKRKLQPPAVAEYAHTHKIPVLQPETPKDQVFIDQLIALKPDVMVVVAYGNILSKQVLAVAPHGCINVHYSLLPKFRGASPVPAAILAGEKDTGVSIIKMTKRMDAGPILNIAKIEIPEQMTSGELLQKLTQSSQPLLLETLKKLEDDSIIEIKQDHDKATYCSILKKQDGKIAWNQPANYLMRFLKAMSPWPGAYTTLKRKEFSKEERIIVHEAIMIDKSAETEVGTVVEVDKNFICVATGEGLLKITQLQRSGRSILSATEFLRGMPISSGDIFC